MIDTDSAVFHSRVDMGSTQVGHVVFRATWINPDKWVDLADQTDDPVLLRGGKEARSYLRQKLSDPARAARVAALRTEIGNSLAEEHAGVLTLSILRMRAGLSQSALAERVGTQQPNIARWEKSPAGIQIETIAKLAKALGSTVEEVAACIAKQIEAAEQTSLEARHE